MRRTRTERLQIARPSVFLSPSLSLSLYISIQMFSCGSGALGAASGRLPAFAQDGSKRLKKAQKGAKGLKKALEKAVRACPVPPVRSKRLFEPASVPPVRSKRLFETAVRDHYSKVLGSATLCSEPLYSALLCSVHVYARVHTSIYIYISATALLASAVGVTSGLQWLCCLQPSWSLPAFKV